MSDLIYDLQKKDDDLKVLEESLLGVTVETSLVVQVEEQVPRPPPPEMGVTIRVIRHLFLVNAVLWFCVGIFGIVPTHILLKKTSFVVPLSLFCTSTGLAVLLNILIFCFRNYHDLVLGLLGSFMLCLFTAFFSLAALLHSLGPFQGALIMFTESVLILMYCSESPNRKRLDPYISFLIMLSGGICVWVIGFIAFVKEQDWFTSVFLFFGCVLGFPLYSSMQIEQASQYHLRELTQAIVGFLSPWKCVKCAKKVHPEEDPSFVLVEKESSAETEGVVNEVTI
jgi:hypothetical protein